MDSRKSGAIAVAGSMDIPSMVLVTVDVLKKIGKLNIRVPTLLRADIWAACINTWDFAANKETTVIALSTLNVAIFEDGLVDQVGDVSRSHTLVKITLEFDGEGSFNWFWIWAGGGDGANNADGSNENSGEFHFED
ncbi:hypothetical protein TWF694_009402 [Orbilia ellipsospora]|uniref:Uncharacterized protein n=1 Tax=Orbilia ellipsospora TaxID=2528407 RepID=A0AAV9XB62_9PEZI